MSMPARWMLVELFAQGDRVKASKAAGGTEYVVWGRPLDALGACSRSSTTRAKDELLARGLLIEHPGAVFVNGRMFSAWAVPVVLDVVDLARRVGLTEQGSISIIAREQGSISITAPGSSDSNSDEEQGSISVIAPKPAHNASRTRARGLIQQQQHANGNNNNTKQHPDPGSAPLEGEEPGSPRASRISELEDWSTNTRTLTYAEARELARAGLRAAHVRRPEQVLEQRPLNDVLGALQRWVDAEEAHQRDPRREPRVVSPGGMVMAALTAGVRFAEVVDFSFARWWDETSPENVVRFALRRGR